MHHLPALPQCRFMPAIFIERSMNCACGLNRNSLFRATSSAGLMLVVFAAASLQASVVHRWSFSEASGTNVADAIGTANGYVVVIGTNADYVRTSGMVRLAGGTRAQADYVQLPPGLVSHLTNVTVELWATPRAGQIWSRLFDFGPGNDTQA